MVHFRKRSKLGKYCFSPKPSKTNFKMKKVWHQIKHKSQRWRSRRCAQSVERQKDRGTKGKLEAVCPDWAINWTLGNFLKSLATIKLPKSPTFFGSFCKGVKIYHLFSEIIYGQLLKTFGNFFLLTLSGSVSKKYRLCSALIVQ